MASDSGLPVVPSQGIPHLPATIAREGRQASKRFLEFFTANIPNDNTRLAYVQAISQFFAWTEGRGFHSLDLIEPIVVAAYLKQHSGSKPTVKQHLAAIRMLFDWLVVGQVLPINPAHAVRGPKHVVKKGKTPVLTAGEARQLLDTIDISRVAGLRDRAIIGVMVYSFARVSAVVGMNAEDYYQQGKRWWLRFNEKGGKHHEVPAHHNAEAYLDAYQQAIGLDLNDKKSPLFRSIDRQGSITVNRMTRNDVLRMVKRRAKKAGLPSSICCHTFRATGITAYLENGGTVENAQNIAAHESPRTTKLYDRRSDEISLDEVERIII
jgi:site-specific recombinase XerD